MVRFNFGDIDWHDPELWRVVQAEVWATESKWRNMLTTDGVNSYGDNKVIWPPAATCDHPMALLQVTDMMAICDGCGRTFELQKFGGNP